MNIKMMNKYVMFERTEPKSVTEGGIVIPDSAKKMSKMGVVIANDPNGDLSLGDKIIFNEYNAIRYETDEEDKSRWIMLEAYVMGVIEYEPKDQANAGVSNEGIDRLEARAEGSC